MNQAETIQLARGHENLLEQLRNTVRRVTDIPMDQRSVTDQALLAAAPRIASDRLNDIEAHYVAAARGTTARRTPGTEERQAAITPAAAPFPGPLAARATRLPMEGLHAAYALVDGDATAATVPEGQAKPVSPLTVTGAMTRAEAIACAVGPVTRQALADTAARPRLEAAAVRAVAVELDRQVLDALWTDTAVPAVTGPTTAEAVRLALYQLQAAGFGGLVVAGPPNLLAAIDPVSLPPGTVMTAADGAGLVVADVAAAVGLAIRGGVQVYESDTVGDDFTRNALHLLAEVPARPVVTDPAAARRISGNGETETRRARTRK